MNKFGFSDILEYQVRISKRHLRISGIVSKICNLSNPEKSCPTGSLSLDALEEIDKRTCPYDYSLAHHDDNHIQQEAYRKAVQESRGALEEDEDDGSKADNNKEQVSLISRY